MSNRLYSSRLDPAPKQTVNVQSGGTSLAVLLTVLFVALKLTGTIDWSWWWVLAPMWIGAAVMIGVLLVALIIGGIALGIAALISRK